ncbi:hypothetical protein ACFVVQ_13455 [Paenibacillus chitinolyticus]|uniref:hypothetical protein n=1 Tax=Paenibacillus chitinolyticus TaxID=79263 RepID=UPI00364935A4
MSTIPNTVKIKFILKDKNGEEIASEDNYLYNIVEYTALINSDTVYFREGIIKKVYHKTEISEKVFYANKLGDIKTEIILVKKD